MVTIRTVYQTYFRLASKISMQASPYHHARVKPFEPPKIQHKLSKNTAKCCHRQVGQHIFTTVLSFFQNCIYALTCPLLDIGALFRADIIQRRSLLTPTRPSDRPEEEVSEQKTVLENGL